MQFLDPSLEAFAWVGGGLMDKAQSENTYINSEVMFWIDLGKLLSLVRSCQLRLDSYPVLLTAHLAYGELVMEMYKLLEIHNMNTF